MSHLDSHIAEAEAVSGALPPPVVEVHDLDAYYGRRKVLHDVNLVARAAMGCSSECETLEHNGSYPHQHIELMQ